MYIKCRKKCTGRKKIIISCNFGTLLFYTLISSNTILRYMFAQGRKDGRTNADHYYVTPSLRGGGQKGYTGWIYTFITRNNRVQTYGWPTLGQTDLRTNATEPNISCISLRWLKSNSYVLCSLSGFSIDILIAQCPKIHMGRQFHIL